MIQKGKGRTMSYWINEIFPYLLAVWAGIFVVCCYVFVRWVRAVERYFGSKPRGRGDA
jgi:hypothetical protein